MKIKEETRICMILSADVQNLQRLCRRLHTCISLSCYNFSLKASHSVLRRFRVKGHEWNHSPSTEISVRNESCQHSFLNSFQKAKSSNYINSPPPPAEAHHCSKASWQAEGFTLVMILKSWQSGDITEKQQHQVKQDIPERAPLSHITVTGVSHDLQDATSAPFKRLKQPLCY